MKKVYIVRYANERGDCGETKGVFLREEDAKRAAKGFGFWGSDGYVIPFNLYEDFEEYENEQ